MLNDKNCLKSKGGLVSCARINVQKNGTCTAVKQASARTMTRINFLLISTTLINTEQLNAS
jgi:hypothetical protein